MQQLSRAENAYLEALGKALARLGEIYEAAAAPTGVPSDHPGPRSRLGGMGLGGGGFPGSDAAQLRSWLETRAATQVPGSGTAGVLGQDEAAPAAATTASEPATPPSSAPLSTHEVYQPLLRYVLELDPPQVSAVLLEADCAYAGARVSAESFYRLPATPEAPALPPRPARPDFERPVLFRGQSTIQCHQPRRDSGLGSLSGGAGGDFAGLRGFFETNDPYRLVGNPQFRALDASLQQAWFLWWDVAKAKDAIEQAKRKLPERQQLLAQADVLARQLRIGQYELPEFRPQPPRP